MTAPSDLICSGCGAEVGYEEPFPFRCPKSERGDDVDHVLVRVLNLPSIEFRWAPSERNPFIQYRALVRSYHLAMAAGMTDAAYAELVTQLDESVAAVDGHGFTITPFARAESLSERLGFSSTGGVWVKDETGNVSGSHKGRHLMGLMIHLRVMEVLGRLPRSRPDLAIASCGNAALAAAVVAAAAGWRLQVFVPLDADPVVVARLKELDATVTACPRDEGVPGDPTFHRLRQAIGEGAVPFTCQGSENGLAIEGGLTLGYEIAQAQAALDRIIVQIGGGALASACAQGLAEAIDLGVLSRMPVFDAVQTEGAAPLARAYRRLADRIAGHPEVGLGGHLHYAAHHRSEFMWPWETEPQSVASGILDDETYDWFRVVRTMFATDGSPVVVDEQTLRLANEVARERTDIDVDHTGSSGLAGLLSMRAGGAVGDDERVAVLFTGARR